MLIYYVKLYSQLCFVDGVCIATTHAGGIVKLVATSIGSMITTRIRSHNFYRWSKAQNETVLLYVASKHQYML